MNILFLLENRPFVHGVVLQLIISLMVYVLARVGYIILTGTKKNLKTEVKYFIGMSYISFVLALTMTYLDLTLDLSTIQYRINLIPFDTVTRYWPLDGEYSVYNLIGNFIIMFPMLPILSYSFNVTSFKKAALFTAFFIFAIEFMQLFVTTTRAFDVDDFILNFGGFLVSGLLWTLIKKVQTPK